MAIPRLLRFLLQDPDFPRSRVASMIAVSGLAGGGLLVAINLSAEQIAMGQRDPRQFVTALILLVIAVYAQHDLLRQMGAAVEEILLKLRLRIGDRLRHADLRFVESGAAAEAAVLARDTQLVSQSALSMALLGRSVLVVIASLIYLGWVSLLALLVTKAFLGTYSFLYWRYIHPNLDRGLRESQVGERRLLWRLRDLVDGFKTIKLSQRINRAVFEGFTQAAVTVAARKRSANIEIVNSFTIGYATFYLLLIALAIVIPTLDRGLSGQVFKIVATVIFILSEMDPWLTWIPEIQRANAALDDLSRLEESLLAASGDDVRGRSAPPPVEFAGLRLDGVAFRYPEHAGRVGFQLGPLDLTVAPGELLFITGGTGSGKTTLLKLLAGLYPAQAGVLRLGRDPVEPGDPTYRELFGAVFQDFHLFQAPPGADPAAAAYWLDAVGLSGTLGFVGGKFSPAALSAGQGRRLAFVAAMLEDKPVYLLDGFAADQDPSFREKFYREILSELRRRGKTVVAATHDDLYFEVADHVLRLTDNGRPA